MMQKLAPTTILYPGKVQVHPLPSSTEQSLPDYADKQLLLDDLSPNQKRAVCSTSRYIRVIAGAGAGKTETLTRRIVYILTSDSFLKPKDIVAFTFTEKAAQSMKDRIYMKLNEIKKQNTLHEIGDMFIGTIHSFCLRLLQDYFGYGNYVVFDDKQEVAFLFQHNREVFTDNYMKNKSLGKKIERFLKHVNMFYDEMIDESRLIKKLAEERHTSFYKSFKAYEDLLENHKILTFSRMTYLAVKKLKRNPNIIEELDIKHLIVDEFQDLNKCQYELVKLIGQRASVFIVGDPRQAIYQWRGSSTKFFEEFSKDFECVEDILIPENRRSAKSIVEYANRFSRSFENTINEPMESTREKVGIVLYYEYQNPKQEAESIANLIHNFVNSGKCQYGDIAILLRSVRKDSSYIIEELDRLKIPYIVSGDAELFKRPEISALRYFFASLSDRAEYISDPSSRERVERVNFVKCGIEYWKKATGVQVFEERVSTWINETKKKENVGLIEALHTLLEVLNFRELDFLKNDFHKVIVSNIGRFSSLLANVESTYRLKWKKVDISRLADNLFFFITQYAVEAYEFLNPEEKTQVNAVQVMTIHQAKGLEWSIVFLPYLNKNVFPSYYVNRVQEFDIPEELFDSQKYQTDIEDERRLFYVAITRAKHVLVLSSSNERSEFVISEENRNPENIPEIEIETAGNLRQEDLISLSVSDVITYHKCPTLYLLREIWEYKPPLKEQMYYGKSMHYCLKLIVDNTIKNKNVNFHQTIDRVIEEQFYMPFADEMLHKNAKNKVKLILENLFKTHHTLLSKAKETELRVELKAENAIVVGRVDLVLKHDNNKDWIVEYKTSDEATTIEDTKKQVYIYTLALEQAGRDVAGGTMIYLDSSKEAGTPIKVEIGQEHKQETENFLRDIIQGMRNNKFDPKNSYCDKCDFKKICKYCYV